MKSFLNLFLVVIIVFCTTAPTCAKKLSKSCRKGTSTCISADTTGKSTEEALQTCISCCTSDTVNIKSEKCFNFCTDKCALEFSGAPITISGK